MLGRQLRYVSGRFQYLLGHDAFQASPMKVAGRSILWLLYCAVGHSPRFVLVDNLRFTVDPVPQQSGCSSAFILRHWVEAELRYLDMLLPVGGTFIDCGANIGIYTVRAAGIVGPQGRVIAIEPGAASFRRLGANIELNRFLYVSAVNKAVSDREGTARLYHADGGPNSFSLIERLGIDHEEVATTTIDRLVSDHDLDRLDCIKLDIEGAEVWALRGAQRALSYFKPMIIFERTSPGTQRATSTETAADILRGLGYQLFQFAGRRLECRPYPTEGTNVLALHPDGARPTRALDLMLPGLTCSPTFIQSRPEALA